MGIKRVFDIICALCGLIVLSPVLFLIIVLIKLTSAGPVFFRQTRVGQYEKLFQIHKFRTMIVNAEASGLKITVGRDPRITSIGHFLRKTKLDELPQLIDVLMGTMSLVGPRPEVPEYVQYYTNDIKGIVLSVRPGITDWASIKMIDENDILARASDPQQIYIQQILPEKLAYAVRYVQTRSLRLDVYLILLTISKIFTR
ncbi:MAG: sugar transferase [Burkholderiales bacterium]|nr:sugar transferase [Burkholderiales bacterium]